MSADASVYLKAVERQWPRLLSQLDRQPFSPSYGSFDRGYWLHRTSDFSSHIRQLGFHSLALLWKHPYPQSVYFENQQVLDWAKAAMLYCCRLQNRDGTFDEWYPGERGWAGPTGYLLHALCDSFWLLEGQLDEITRDRVRQAIGRAALFLADGWEPDVLSNHVAMAILPIHEASLITGDSRLQRGGERLWQQFLEHQCFEEGWGLEYDGPDVGYQTASLSFLARHHRLTPTKEIKDWAEHALNFVSYFYFPNGNFSHRFGSRQTSVNFVFAMEYWAEFFPLARRMARHQREALQQGRLLAPETHEDHYLIYRCPEFFEAYLAGHKRESSASTEKGEKALPYEREPFTQHFERAKILVRNDEESYQLINGGRGGAFQIHPKEADRKEVIDAGWWAQTVKGTLTSSAMEADSEVIVSENSCVVRGGAVRVKSPRFTPVTQVLFRIFLILFARHERLSRRLKSLIRGILMFGGRQREVRYEREICWEGNKYQVCDRIHAPKSFLQRLRVGGNAETRMVPQSAYFEESDLELLIREYSSEQIEAHRRGEEYVFSREIV